MGTEIAIVLVQGFSFIFSIIYLMKKYGFSFYKEDIGFFKCFNKYFMHDYYHYY